MISRAAYPAAAPLARPALWLTGAERWLLLVGLCIALGGLAGRGLARQYLAKPDTSAAALPLPPPWALRGSLIGLAASTALLVTALAGPGMAASLARPPVAGLGSRATGVIAAAELACFALAAVLLRLRQPGWSVLPLLGVVLAEGIRAHPEGMIPVAGALLTYCHLLPAVLWAGLLVYTARAAIAWRASPQSARGLLRLYGTAAAWLFAVVVVTGVISALLLVPVGSLLTTTYGRFLIAKAALVAVVTALALASRAGLRHSAEPGTGLPLATRLELGALAAVLAATGLLTVLTPPAKPVFPAATRLTHHRSCWAAMGSPGHSFIASRLSCAGYDPAAGPSAKARSTLAVTRLVKRPQAAVMPKSFCPQKDSTQRMVPALKTPAPPRWA